MATYSEVTTLTGWAAVINDPTDSEDANKLAQVDLQTRKFVNTLGNLIVDSTTNMVKPGVIADATLTGKVKGSTSNTGTQQGIVQGTVSTPDLRNDAVTTTKIVDDAITTAKIADLQITTDLLAAKNVTAAKIADATITVAQLAANAVETTIIKDLNVTTDKLAANAVTAAKIANNVVSGTQLVTGGAAGAVLIAGASPFNFAPQVIKGGATLASDGTLTLTTSNECEIAERANNTTACGASANTTWHVRGLSTKCAWVETWRVPVASFVTIQTSGKFQMAAGTYIIDASAPAYKSGKHITRLVRYNSGDAVQETFYGTSEVSAAADGVQTTSHVRAKITVANATDYIQLEHYTEAQELTDGLGYPTSSGGTYEVYARVHIKQIA